MANTKRRLKKRNKALHQLENLDEQSSRVLFIHYSSESFFDLEGGQTARITSIAIKYLETGQTVSFSIHKTAEREKKLQSISDDYDDLEKLMLDDFFNFIEKHQQHKWIHWNMRDAGFGFQAINHRYAVLGGKPIEIPADNKYDLADKLKVIYGSNYIGHKRLIKITKKNGISDLNFLDGEAEVEAFERKEYVKLHHSTLRKVNIFQDLFEKILDKDLKTDATWKEIYGFTPQGIYAAWRENWIFNLTIFLLGVLLSGTISAVFF